jgi:predicted acylesterase/phospholipase RssA
MTASHVRARRPATAIEVLLPGFVEIIQRFAFLDTMPVPPPPFPEWRIVAADTRGRRHVFTTGEASLSLAVAASCAVPGLFVPIRHDGRRLLDRGLHSTTNADLAADDDSGTVIVLAPMCVRLDDSSAATMTAQAKLDREVPQLDAAGKRVVTFRPSMALRRQMDGTRCRARGPATSPGRPSSKRRTCSRKSIRLAGTGANVSLTGRAAPSGMVARCVVELVRG